MYTHEHTIWWFEEAVHYLEMAVAALERHSTGSCLRQLQHATEFHLKALIRHHSGDHPFIRNPYTLLHIAALYTPRIRTIFARHTREEIRLFSYLNPYRFIPEDEEDTVTKEELQVLILRVRLLEDMGRAVVAQESVE